jgi:hypothetical protein
MDQNPMPVEAGVLSTEFTVSSMNLVPRPRSSKTGSGAAGLRGSKGNDETRSFNSICCPLGLRALGLSDICPAAPLPRRPASLTRTVPSHTGCS